MSERPTPDSTRRDGVAARPIRLADGSDWGFASPTVLLIPRPETRYDGFGRPVDRVVVELGFGYPLAIRRLLGDVRTACEQGPISSQYEAFMALAISLLRRAHDVSLTTACELLTVPDDQLPRLAGEVMEVVSGQEVSDGREPRGDTET